MIYIYLFILKKNSFIFVHSNIEVGKYWGGSTFLFKCFIIKFMKDYLYRFKRLCYLSWTFAQWITPGV